MISNYRDHAANERTYLAWVRVAIAMMAFGFVVERFDLMLKFAGGAVVVRPMPWPLAGEIAGLALMLAGLAIVLAATVRFVRVARQIDAATTHPGAGERLDLALAILMAVLGCALIGYVGLSLAQAR